MTSTELRALLSRLSLTQGRAAALLGVDYRTVRKWACDERAVPEPVARLLRAIEQVPGMREWLDAA